MMAKFLYWLTGYLPCRFINDGEHDYLERYYLFTIFGWRFYIHQFVGSDPDRGLHDHPFAKAYSLILSGWYFEQTRSGTRQVRWFNSLTGDTFHRVVLPPIGKLDCELVKSPDGYLRIEADRKRQPCWTLFFHKAGNVKPWGFWRRLETGGEGVYMFTPYRYDREGNQKDWWLTAKRRGEA